MGISIHFFDDCRMQDQIGMGPGWEPSRTPGLHDATMMTYIKVSTPRPWWVEAIPALDPTLGRQMVSGEVLGAGVFVQERSSPCR